MTRHGTLMHSAQPRGDLSMAEELNVMHKPLARSYSMYESLPNNPFPQGMHDVVLRSRAVEWRRVFIIRATRHEKTSWYYCCEVPPTFAPTLNKKAVESRSSI